MRLKLIGYGLDIPVVYYYGDNFYELESINDVDVIMVGLKEPFHILINRTDRIRPVLAGISIGHAMVTAGTLGWFGRLNGRAVILTNAHVAHPNPCSESAPGILDIIQPGAYDGGSMPYDTIGYYHSHIPLGSSNECPVANGLVWLLNAISRMLGRKTRFATYVEKTFDSDLALVSLREDIEYNVSVLYGNGVKINPAEKGWGFAGLLFAGSGERAIITKARNILKHYPGLDLYGAKPAELEPGMKVVKCGRTTGCTEGVIESASAVVKVSGYPCGSVVFEDVAVAIIKSSGGDSGSSVWVVG